MNDGRDRKGLAHAILAWAARPEERGVGAHQAVVVQRLDDGAALRFGRIVNGGGEEGKRIVEVDDVRAFPADQRPDLSIARRAPDRAEAQPDRMDAGYRVVMHRVPDHLVAVRLQQRRFGGEYLVLSPPLLVVVVAQQDFHRASLRKAAPIPEPGYQCRCGRSWKNRKRRPDRRAKRNSSSVTSELSPRTTAASRSFPSTVWYSRPS